MNCPSGKIRYRDRIAAQLELAMVGHRRHERRIKYERRAYPCPQCHGWHLTSQGTR